MHLYIHPHWKYHTDTCTYVHWYHHTHTHTHWCFGVCAHAYTYTCTYIHTYIHTYTPNKHKKQKNTGRNTCHSSSTRWKKKSFFEMWYNHMVTSATASTSVVIVLLPTTYSIIHIVYTVHTLSHNHIVYTKQQEYDSLCTSCTSCTSCTTTMRYTTYTAYTTAIRTVCVVMLASQPYNGLQSTAWWASVTLGISL